MTGVLGYERHDDNVAPGQQGGTRLVDVAAEVAQQTVRIEANFLRLPLFTLDTKHMRTLEGISCEGTFRRGTRDYRFTYRVTRNVDTYYPGPLARSAHFALLSLATDRGLPLLNPIIFTWNQLFARMGISATGKAMDSVREALTATKGLMIKSHAALFSKALGQTINTDETTVVSLYDRLEFFGTTREDGSRVNVNGVWLSDWYRDNLNALYSAPLDYALWVRLNRKSLIASRLYEFLSFKFYGRDLLRFNYSTLAQSIPVRTERYLSSAKHQLQPSFDLLIAEGILSQVQWVASAAGDPQLLLHRGTRLKPSPQTEDTLADLGDDFTMDRVDTTESPAASLVVSFHEASGNKTFTPTKPELALAEELIAKHGIKLVMELLPKVIKRVKIAWPDAKTFVAIGRYWDEVLREYERETRRVQQVADAENSVERDRQRKVREAQNRAVLKALWDSLDHAEREQIRATVLAAQPKQLEKFPAIIEGFCLTELGIRKGL